MEDDEGYCDPFQTDVGERIVTSGCASAMVADAAVVAAVMCSEGHVQLRASEGPGLSDKTESWPGPKGPEPGEMLHLPIFSDIGVTNLKGLSLDFGDVSDPHVSVGGIVSGPGPPDPELGDTLDLPDFSADIETGPGESLPKSGSMLVRPVILDECVLNPREVSAGVVPDGPGSANDYGTGSGEPTPRCAVVLSERDAWNVIENEHEGPPCQYGYRLRLRDCDDNTQMGDEGWMY